MISFVIPTLNEEKTIEKTLECLAGFKEEHEIIISDGKSKDKTIEIARRFTDKIVVHDKPVRQTIAMARNAGAAVAAGEYVVFLDADVFIPDINKFFVKAKGIFNAYPQVVGVTTYYLVFPEMRTWADNLFFKLLGMNFLISNNLFRIGASAGEFQMIKRESFKKTGGFNEKLAVAEDMDMFRRLSKIGRTYFMRDLMVLHTGRRAHTIGWPKLLSQWFANTVFGLFNKSASKEWKEIR